MEPPRAMTTAIAFSNASFVMMSLLVSPFCSMPTTAWPASRALASRLRSTDGGLADPTDPTSADPNCNAHLQLWIDANSDYAQQPAEVVALTALGQHLAHARGREQVRDAAAVTADQPTPPLPLGAVASAPAPAAAPAPAPAPAPEKIPVGRRMATIATSALVAMRLRRPSRQDRPKR